MIELVNDLMVVGIGVLFAMFVFALLGLTLIVRKRKK